MAGLYETFITAIQPPFMQRPRIQAFLGTFGKELDREEGLLEEASLAAVIEKAPDDALPEIGLSRLLPQYPGESAANYRNRLLASVTFWRQSGTAKSLEDALQYAFPLVTPWAILEYWEDPASFNITGFWAQFLIVADPPAPIGEGWKLGDTPTGDGKDLGAPGVYLGSNLTDDQTTLLLNLIRDLKAAYTVCAGVQLVFAPANIVILFPNFQ